MRQILHNFAAGVALVATPIVASAAPDWASFSQDVVIIGEYHDNPGHHQMQADAVAALKPKAVVFEMLTPWEADALGNIARTEEAMRTGVADFHWGNITDYTGLLAEAPVIVGAALSRDEMRGAFAEGAEAIFGEKAKEFGLAETLPEEELAERKQLQFEAHCEAMPLEMMGGMVEAQRLRDATFARVVLHALDTYGAPIVLITGNGHARSDWGVPYYLAKAKPDVSVVSVGQGEDGSTPPGSFDVLLTDAKAPERGDPCDAFR